MAAVNVQAKHYLYLSCPKRARSSNKWCNAILQHVKKRITNPLRDMMKKMKTKTKLKKSSFLESSRPSIQTVPRNYDFSTDFSSVSKFMLSRMPFDCSPGQGQVERLPEIDVDYYTDDYEEDIELSTSIYHTPNTSLDEIGGMIAYDNFMCSSLSELGESSNISKVVDDPTDFVCTICVEHKEAHERFDIKICSHAYCTDCMVNYVASKLQENITSIRCPVPDCVGLLEPEYCRPILLRRCLIGGEDCSAMLIDDGTEVVRQSGCPNCWRMFCAQCKVPWHEGIKCEEFLKLNKDEREKEDIISPKCRFYVEKSVGCMFMMCRCRTAFCYRCGDVLMDNHNHYCPSCEGGLMCSIMLVRKLLQILLFINSC
ncbi:E3 ubiquitin-protein ligase RNF217 [Pyrus ussuriensis x Pyrus communis]|uniref:E3 ubiquitin-protein ligase RNF217 n=1 Tax=Pyrus ussuriensis x Pyrus communis TaxID=2448454 RepID=A0A5N5I140_9ROSA|nr:E3 ubiquitin-protein ligase RNF217 [Pyrus ussuriensis x Pyrus communis]